MITKKTPLRRDNGVQGTQNGRQQAQGIQSGDLEPAHHMQGIKERGWLTGENEMLLGNVSLCAKCYLLNPNKWVSSEGKVRR